MSDDTERNLRMELMMADISLKRKQAFWETPRNIIILVGAAVAIAGTLTGWLGYRAGQDSNRPIIVQVVPAPVNAPASK